jgi:hypothetical protein
MAIAAVSGLGQILMDAMPLGHEEKSSFFSCTLGQRNVLYLFPPSIETKASQRLSKGASARFGLPKCFPPIRRLFLEEN